MNFIEQDFLQATINNTSFIVENIDNSSDTNFLGIFSSYTKAQKFMVRCILNETIESINSGDKEDIKIQYKNNSNNYFIFSGCFNVNLNKIIYDVAEDKFDRFIPRYSFTNDFDKVKNKDYINVIQVNPKRSKLKKNNN